jgi:very-short-patch-repair endonuclease
VIRTHHGGRHGASYAELAQSLRQTSTNEERRLWAVLRGRRFGDSKFRRQHQFGRYVLDFYEVEWRLAIELDGSQHFTDEGEASDTARTAYLTRHGIRVLRFTNLEVKQNLEGVLEAIKEALATPSPGGRGQG